MLYTTANGGGHESREGGGGGGGGRRGGYPLFVNPLYKNGEPPQILFYQGRLQAFEYSHNIYIESTR